MSDEQTPVEKLDAAVRGYVQWLADEDGEGQVFVTHSFVAWEQVRADEAGDYIYVTHYSIPSPGSPAQSEGVAVGGLRALRRDLTEPVNEDDG